MKQKITAGMLSVLLLVSGYHSLSQEQPKSLDQELPKPLKAVQRGTQLMKVRREIVKFRDGAQVTAVITAPVDKTVKVVGMAPDGKASLALARTEIGLNDPFENNLGYLWLCDGQGKAIFQIMAEPTFCNIYNWSASSQFALLSYPSLPHSLYRVSLPYAIVDLKNARRYLLPSLEPNGTATSFLWARNSEVLVYRERIGGSYHHRSAEVVADQLVCKDITDEAAVSLLGEAYRQADKLMQEFVDSRDYSSFGNILPSPSGRRTLVQYGFPQRNYLFDVCVVDSRGTILRNHKDSTAAKAQEYFQWVGGDKGLIGYAPPPGDGYGYAFYYDDDPEERGKSLRHLLTLLYIGTNKTVQGKAPMHRQGDDVTFLAGTFRPKYRTARK